MKYQLLLDKAIKASRLALCRQGLPNDWYVLALWGLLWLRGTILNEREKGWGHTAYSWWTACVCCQGSHYYGFLWVPALIDGYEISIWGSSVLISSSCNSPCRAIDIWNVVGLRILNAFKALMCACAYTYWLNALVYTHKLIELMCRDFSNNKCPISFPRLKALCHPLKIYLRVVCVWVACMCGTAKWNLHRQWVCKLEHLAEGLLSAGTSVSF